MKKNIKHIIGLLVILTIGYFIADSILFKAAKPKFINKNGFQANYFSKNNTKNKTAIILLGGNQWGDYWAQELSSNGFVGLSLPYTRKEGLPQLPEKINLEYFESAIKWLQKQPEVNPNKIVVMGASRNAELALVLASTFPHLINGVVAYAPSAVSWSNTVLPYNSDEVKASWKYKNIDIPFVPMPKIQGNNSNKIETLPYWAEGLSKTDAVNKAIIKVENINGSILLFSGKDDKVWPSSIMADMIEKRLKANNFKFPFQNIKYENTGHLISTNPETKSAERTGKMIIAGKEYEFEFGGTNKGDYSAKQDAKNKLIQFINEL